MRSPLPSPLVSALPSPLPDPLGMGGGGLGPELVTNGNFSADTDWSKDAAWTIPSPFGAAVYDDTASGSIQQVKTWGMVNGRTYRIAFEVADLASGTALIRPSIVQYAGNIIQGVYSDYANGGHELFYTLTNIHTVNVVDFRVLAVDTSGPFKLKNVSIRQVL